MYVINRTYKVLGWTLVCWQKMDMWDLKRKKIKNKKDLGIERWSEREVIFAGKKWNNKVTFKHLFSCFSNKSLMTYKIWCNTLKTSTFSKECKSVIMVFRGTITINRKVFPLHWNHLLFASFYDLYKVKVN